MPRSWIERRRIHRQAKQKLGMPIDMQDRADFMTQCVIQMQSEGIDDIDDARAVCEALIEEEASLFDF